MNHHLHYVIAVATVGLLSAVSSSQAASNLNSSKSNAVKVVATAADEAACLKAGGAVAMQGGKKVCVTPATNPNSSRSN